MAKHRNPKRPMSEINVVPYIDVMLVLLVIFMITAPLLTQGVKVDLPKADAKVVDTTSADPLIVTVTAEGDYYINYGENKDDPVSMETILTRTQALLRHRPNTQVHIKGHSTVPYGDVVIVMALLQKAGAESVGLLTDPPENQRQ